MHYCGWAVACGDPKGTTMHARATVLGLVLFLSLSASAQSALVVEIGNLPSLAANGVGTIDVYVSSNAGDTDPPDVLSLFQLELQIIKTNTVPGSTGTLEFLALQPESQFTAGDYVFAGDSFAVDFILPFTVGAVVAPDTYRIGDSTSSFADVTLSSTPLLLARLNVQNIGGTANDQFQIRLDSSSSALGDFTAFESTLTDPFDAELELAYTSTAGTVTITGPPGVGDPNVIPEPASAIVWGLGIAAIGLCRRYRRR